MKTLYLSKFAIFMIAVIIFALGILIPWVIVPSLYPTGSILVPVQNKTPLQISTVIIPKYSEDQSAGKNYEPSHLVVVLGINNTVRWINEADIGNTVAANNYDDPDFWNATTFPHGGIITPGDSFNYTFTKIGRFGFHGEPHPWLQGWVTVLPQSSENATQTVVLNSTQIVSPCEIFQVPCPNNPIFTAQKFGSNIYIEKMTINGIDHYAVVNPEGYCVYPDSNSQSCTNADDLAMLRLVGVNVSIPQEITNTKNYDPFGITALIIYHPPLGCLGPPGNGTYGCPPNNFYLKINSNSTAYLLGYNICDGDSCAKSSGLSVLLPINTILKPNYQMIGLPVNLQWKDGDTVSIQLQVSPILDNKTGLLVNHGNSTIVP
ncbi:MAG: cupredoxin domain-containing protein [Nitrosotalea sp.]